MATRLEAQPLIDLFGLQPVCARPVRAFARKGVMLVIGGIGKANAALGTAWLIERYRPDLIFNLGAAGAVDRACILGSIWEIARIFEPDRPDLVTGLPLEHALQPITGLPTAILATQDRPVITDAEREALSAKVQLVDMEGAAVVQVSRRYGCGCVLVKFVSDTGQDQDIRFNIENLRDDFCASVARVITRPYPLEPEPVGP